MHRDKAPDESDHLSYLPCQGQPQVMAEYDPKVSEMIQLTFEGAV
jgi:hypothetical protein